MDTLPPEILIDIFQYLDYFDLKVTIPFVSKKFSYALEIGLTAKKGIIAQKLHQDHFDPTAKENLTFRITRGRFSAYREDQERANQKGFTVHPAFKMIKCDFSSSDDDIFFIRNDKLSGLSVASENAISPAVGTSIFDSVLDSVRPELANGNESSITVLKVMEGLRRKVDWEQVLEGPVLEWFLDARGYGTASESEAKQILLDYEQARRRHWEWYAWTGDVCVHVTKEGDIKLCVKLGKLRDDSHRET